MDTLGKPIVETEDGFVVLNPLLPYVDHPTTNLIDLQQLLSRHSGPGSWQKMFVAMPLRDDCLVLQCQLGKPAVKKPETCTDLWDTGDPGVLHEGKVITIDLHDLGIDGDQATLGNAMKALSENTRTRYGWKVDWTEGTAEWGFKDDGDEEDDMFNRLSLKEYERRYGELSDFGEDERLDGSESNDDTQHFNSKDELGACGPDRIEDAEKEERESGNECDKDHV